MRSSVSIQTRLNESSWPDWRLTPKAGVLIFAALATLEIAVVVRPGHDRSRVPQTQASSRATKTPSALATGGTAPGWSAGSSASYPVATMAASARSSCSEATLAGPFPWRQRSSRLYLLESVAVAGMKPRPVRVYLPETYDRSPSRRFPVVYAHDGQLAFRGGLEVHRALDGLAREGRIEPHILVTVDRTRDRSRELKPGSASAEVPSLQRYAEMLVHWVKPIVDGTFRTRCNRESTSIVGYSLGGLANVYLATRYSNVFSGYAWMSPSLWWADGRALASWREHQGVLPKRLWIDAGTREGRPSESVPYFIRDIREARDIALAKGMVIGDDLGYLEDAGAPHAGWAGARRMRYALAFILATERPTNLAPTDLSVFVFDQLKPARKKTTLAVTATYANLFRLTWPNEATEVRSLNTQVATVDEHGMIEGLRPGVAVIEAELGPLRAGDAVFVH